MGMIYSSKNPSPLLVQATNVVILLSLRFHAYVFSSSILILQAGSLQLMPISIEITYGLERILMLLQVW